jgi:DNA-directed RNA polymerase subunit A'
VSGKQIFSLSYQKHSTTCLKQTFAKAALNVKKKNANTTLTSLFAWSTGFSVIDRRSIGSEQSESLLHRIIKDYGTQAGRAFLNNVTHLLKLFISMRGFSYTYDQHSTFTKSTQPHGKNHGPHTEENHEHIANYKTLLCRVYQVKL